MAARRTMRRMSRSATEARYFARAPKEAARPDCCKRRKIPFLPAQPRRPIADSGPAGGGRAHTARAEQSRSPERSADSSASRRNKFQGGGWGLGTSEWKNQKEER